MKMAVRITSFVFLSLIVAAIYLSPVRSQTTPPHLPPSPGPISILGPHANLSVSGSSGRVALPNVTGAFQAVTLYNDGTQELFFKMGDVTVVAATTDYPLAGGQSITFWISTSTNVAAITSTSTTTLRVFQSNGPLR